MFKFDFKVEEETDNSPFSNVKVNKDIEKTEQDVNIDWYDSEEIVPDVDVLEDMDLYRLRASSTELKDISLSYMPSGFLLEDVRTRDESGFDMKRAEQNNSDLIPGVYEGGAKIWECTIDLLTYLANNCERDMWQDKHVLDLGCGSGLLGLYAYRCGSKVHFQDYNKDVLKNITIPNVLLNVQVPPEDMNLENLMKRVRFFSGDWNKWVELTGNEEQFDVILTSETIYNPENHQKLLNALFTKLKPDGVVLLAAKTYYFGVGGGLRKFEELIAFDKRFKSKVLWIATEGVSREIVEIRKLIKT